MRTTILFIILSFSSVVCFAQTLTGFVFDAETKEPLSGASVYLNGTTIGANTDITGKYEINIRTVLYTQLIVSFMGYKQVEIEKPYEFLPDTI